MINTVKQKIAEPIKTRLLLSIGLLCLCLGLTLASVNVYFGEENRRETTQRLHQRLAEKIVADHLLMNNKIPDAAGVKKLFEELMILGPNFEFYVLSTEGDVLAHSIPQDQIQLKRIAMEPIRYFLKCLKKNHVSSFPIYGDNPITGETAIFSAAPIVVDNAENGILYIVLGSQIHSHIMRSTAPKITQQQIWTTLLISACFFAILFFILSVFVTKPLRKLASSVFQHQLSKNQEMQSHWDSNSNNEFDKVGSAFEEARQQINRQYFQLAKKDDLRKELLAHLSHDLRTPMASMLGYLETYLIHDTSEIEKRKYVEIAKKNAIKTNRLLEQLFELAHLDQDQVKMEIETFPIAELLLDIAASCEVKAKKKRIQIKIIPKDLSILVEGDIQKLDRVFTNLLENAIRHTPSEGVITILIQPTDEHIFICVKDTGCGISEEDLPQIFDAHFKAKNSVRENTAHGGLGLAITKRLVELHGSKIKVASELGEGTTFYFHLTPGTL